MKKPKKKKNVREKFFSLMLAHNRFVRLSFAAFIQLSFYANIQVDGCRYVSKGGKLWTVYNCSIFKLFAILFFAKYNIVNIIRYLSCSIPYHIFFNSFSLLTSIDCFALFSAAGRYILMSIHGLPSLVSHFIQTTNQRLNTFDSISSRLSLL